jgi:hypothetical protein
VSKRQHHVHETRAERERRSLWLKVGVWIFLAIFVFSVAGGVVLVGGLGNH